MKLRDWRKKNRYTLPAFVKFYFNESGETVSIRTIDNWENGVTLPDVAQGEHIRKMTDDKVPPSSFTRK